MKLSDCINIEKLQNICTSFYNAFGIPHGIMDNEGEWIVSEGWQEVCTEFFRVNPDSRKLCHKSDKRMLSIVASMRDNYKTDTCELGLEHVCYPIIVNGHRVGSFWLGQFFYAHPDLDYFRNLAQKYLFDTNNFIKAVNKCPVVSREHIDKLMAFFIPFVEIITDKGFESLKRKEYQLELLELKKQLEKHVDNLESILPLCSFCKKIRIGKDSWEQIDAYIHKNFNKNISHSICPECLKKNYPELIEDILQKE